MTARLNYNKIAGAGMRALNSVHAYVGETGLPKTLIDLVYLRTSQINGCAYCIDMHSKDLLDLNFPLEKLMLVPVWYEATEMFTDKERAALRWAETVTRIEQTQVPDAEFEAVSKVFSEKEVVDLTIAIGIMNAFNRMAVSFRAVPKSALQAQQVHS